MFRINENVFAPKPVDDLLPTHQIAILLCQQDEQFHGDAFELQDVSVAAKLETGAVQLKFAELVIKRRHG